MISVPFLIFHSCYDVANIYVVSFFCMASNASKNCEFTVFTFLGATPLPKTMFAYWLFSGDLMFDNWLGTTTNNFSKDQLDIAWNTAGLKTIIFPSMSVTTIYALDMYYFPFLKARFQDALLLIQIILTKSFTFHFSII